MLVPLAFNTFYVVAQAQWTAAITATTTEWLGDDVPQVADLRTLLGSALPPFVSVELNVTDGYVVPVLPAP